MLKDLRELFDEDEEESFDTPEDVRRRTMIIIGGVAGGVILLIVICVAIYSIFFGPAQTAARQTQVAENATQIAAINQGTAEASAGTEAAATSLAASPTPTRTPRPSPTETQAGTKTPTEVPTNTVEPTETPTPTLVPTNTPAPTTTPDVIFNENFEGSGGAWPPADQDTYSYGTALGGFRIIVKSAQVDSWTVRNREFTDVRLEVEVSRLAGPEAGVGGLICRFQNSGNYYAGVVDGQGGYRIIEKRGGVNNDLVEPGQADVIVTGEEFNRIRFDCVGDVLTLYVNGQKMAEVQDDSFTEGNVGLLASTFELPGLEVLFDNFLIARP